jgi:hypothetical protein
MVTEERELGSLIGSDKVEGTRCLAPTMPRSDRSTAS